MMYENPDRQPNPESVMTGVKQMADVVLSEHTLDEIFDLVVALPSSTLPEVMGTSLTLLDKSHAYTSNSTGPLPSALDEVQYASGAGPCLSAAEDSTITVIASVAEETRFPEFTAAALDRGVHSVISLPLTVEGRTFGSLNVYGRTADAFQGKEQEVGSLLAGQAATLVANATALDEARALADQLQEALGTREVIGEAKGILMEREGCASDEAFGMLKRASQNTNTKLRDIAEQVVRGAFQEP